MDVALVIVWMWGTRWRLGVEEDKGFCLREIGRGRGLFTGKVVSFVILSGSKDRARSMDRPYYAYPYPYSRSLCLDTLPR